MAVPLILSGPLGMTDPVDIGKLIATMFFVSGITTLLQATWGNRLPIIQGGTFSFLAPTIAICSMAGLADQGWEVKMQHIQGAIIAGAIFEIIIGMSGMVGKLLRYVGPITIAPTIALIGLCLFKFGAPNAGAHWPIGGLTIALIILFSQYLRKTARAFELYPILMAIVGAWGVAAICTFAGVFEAGHPSHQPRYFSQRPLVSGALSLSMGHAGLWCRSHCRNDCRICRLNGQIDWRLLCLRPLGRRPTA